MYIVNSGLIDYYTALQLQRKIADLKGKTGFPDILFLMEHPPVITVGHRGKKENILVTENYLKEKNIPLYFIERGGDVTYHGYGQLVGYPIIKLNNYKLKIKDFIDKIEETLIQTLNFYEIEGERNPINHGVWIGKNKIASIGVGIKRWVTFHGFALNVNTDPEEFNIIRPCGLYNTGIISMKKLKGKPFELKEVSGIITDKFSELFKVKAVTISLKKLAEELDFL